jgi:hypothetical protein
MPLVALLTPNAVPLKNSSVPKSRAVAQPSAKRLLATAQSMAPGCVGEPAAVAKQALPEKQNSHSDSRLSG